MRGLHRRTLPVSCFLCLLLPGCGFPNFGAIGLDVAGDHGGGGGTETWTGNLTGNSRPAMCSTGEFSEDYRVTLIFDSSIADKFIGSPGGGFVYGTGTYGGGEGVYQQSQAPDVCMLQTTNVTNLPLELQAFWDADFTPSRPGILMSSPQTLIRAHVTMTSTGGDASVEVSSLSLAADSVTATEMTGTWSTSGGGSSSGNSASGTFRFVKSAP